MFPAYNHQPRRVGFQVQERINALGMGQKMQDLPEHLWHDSFRFYVKEDPNRRGGPNLRMIRLDPTKPSLTVTAYVFNKFVHPYEDRFITPREAARLQGFPDDLEFQGTLTSSQQQVGNAVPVQLGEAVFKQILNFAKTITSETVFPALSIFSGAGGLDLGALYASNEERRVQTVLSLDNDKDCCRTLQNYPSFKSKVIQEDISKITEAATLVRDTSISKNDFWILYGGPPCQSFSQAGKQKGDKDPRGQLIDEFLRFVKELKPSVFVMENVRGLAGIDKGNLLKQILTQMSVLGYNVDCSLLNAADFGAPQLRKRLIFIGTRSDLGKICLPHPTHAAQITLFSPSRYKTVKDAFAGLPSYATQQALLLPSV